MLELLTGAALLGAMVATCLGGLLGYRMGRRHALAEFSHELRTRREVGVRVLEELARTWGAELTIMDVPRMVERR